MPTMLLIPWFRVGPWSVSSPFGSGELTIYAYALLVWLGLVVGVLVAAWFAKTHERPLGLVLSLAIYLVAFGFPISALLNAMFYEPDAFVEVLRDPSQLQSFHYGLSSYGGVMGALFGGLVWKWRHGESFVYVGDATAFGAPFGWSIARLGCFLSHDHPGRRSDFFLAVADYPVGAQPYSARHDLGLYDMLVLIAIAVVFAFLSRQPRVNGFYLALFGLLYTPVRFMLDFLRAPLSEGGDVRYALLTPGQYASIVLCGAAAALMTWGIAKNRAE